MNPTYISAYRMTDLTIKWISFTHFETSSRGFVCHTEPHFSGAVCDKQKKTLIINNTGSAVISGFPLLSSPTCCASCSSKLRQWGDVSFMTEAEVFDNSTLHWITQSLTSPNCLAAVTMEGETLRPFTSSGMTPRSTTEAASPTTRILQIWVMCLMRRTWFEVERLRPVVSSEVN